MAWKDEALAAFHALAADVGVQAQWTDGSGIVHSNDVLFVEPTQDVLGGMQLSDEYAFDFDPADFPGLKRGEVVVVDGVPYTVRENPLNAEDGFTLKAKLKLKP